MNRLLKFLMLSMAAAPLLVSCSMDADAPGDYADYPRYYAYVTVNVDGRSYYFTGDDGKTYYPGDVKRIDMYETTDEYGDSKDGRRAFIRFNMMYEPQSGYDYNVILYYVEDILSKTVEVAATEDEVEAAGDDRLRIEEAAFQGDWLDIIFEIETTPYSMHKMTLLDNRTIDAPAGMPADYQYLEFRQEAEDMTGGNINKGIASYKLGAYHPAATGMKGFYVRINNLDGNVEYVTIPYKASTLNAVMQLKELPTPYMDRIR